MLFNAKISNFKAISWWVQIIFNEMVMSILYWTNMLNWVFIVLAHWNNRPLVDMSFYSDTLSWFCANIKAAFLALK